MKQHASDEIKTVVVQDQVSAGTSLVTSSASADSLGYDAARAVAVTSTATTGTVLTLNLYSVATNVQTGGTLEASATFTSANGTDATLKSLIVDVIKPTHRYLYATLSRATQNCVVDTILIELYRAKAVAVSQDATNIAITKAVAGGVV